MIRRHAALPLPVEKQEGQGKHDRHREKGNYAERPAPPFLSMTVSMTSGMKLN